MLVEMDPKTCMDHVTHEGKHKLPCVETSRAIHGMPQSSLLCHRKFRKSLEESKFTVDPHDACVANKMARGTQMTVAWHVDDPKVSHKRKEAVD